MVPFLISGWFAITIFANRLKADFRPRPVRYRVSFLIGRGQPAPSRRHVEARSSGTQNLGHTALDHTYCMVADQWLVFFIIGDADVVSLCCLAGKEWPLALATD